MFAKPSDSKARSIWARHSAALGKKPLFAKSEKAGSIYVYEQIGVDFWTGGGVTAKSVLAALNEMKGVKTLDIFINSEGGDVFEAKGIYSQLKRFQAEKVVHVDGLCASAASFIAMAGDRIVSSPVATWMIHEARAIAFGQAEDMLAMAELLKLENETLAKTYAERTENSVKDVAEWMREESWMNAAQAKERGFTDEIAEEEAEGEGEKVAATAGDLSALSTRTQQLTALAKQSHRLRQLQPNPPGQPGKKSA